MSQEEFCQRYFPLMPALLAVARRLASSPEDAEDAVQETMARLWQRLSADGAEAVGEGYAVAMVRNLCLDQLRRAPHTATLEEAETRTADAGSAERREAAAAMGGLLGRLAPRARRLLVLRHVGDYSMRQLSELTGQNETAVRQQLSRARRQLKTLYENEERS